MDAFKIYIYIYMYNLKKRSGQQGCNMQTDMPRERGEYNNIAPFYLQNTSNINIDLPFSDDFVNDM